MLTDQDRRILQFEEHWSGHPIGWEIAIRDTFGWHKARHIMIVNRIIATPEAVAEFPQLVYRVQAVNSRRGNERDRRLLRRDA